MEKGKKTPRNRAELGHFDHRSFYEQLSKKIQTMRKEGNFGSADNFASDIEISRVGMGNYESGNFNDMKVSILLKIIDGLGMTPKQFFSEGFD
jgi:DNA-binding XRE family transcriptional regulator